MSSKSVSVINLSRMIILCVATSQLANSIPIDITNNGNIRNNNPPPPHVRHNPNQHHQQPIKTFLENEELGRLHPNHNQFKRHSITPRDAKLTPGNFQQSAESFNRGNDGRSAYHKHEEFQQQPRSNHFRRQSPGNQGPGEAPETRQGPFRQNFQHPIPTQGWLPWTNNMHPEENPLRPVPDPFESHFHESILTDNERIPNSIGSRDDSKYSIPYPMEHQKRFQEKASSSLTDHRQSAPSVVAIIVPGVNGNPTLFIEYDVSDNDVTYETTVEVEEGAENGSNVESNEI